MAETLFSRQQVALLAGIPEDALSFWLKRDLLRSEIDPAGGRRHRRFSRDSVKIAAILRGAWSAGLNIEALTGLSGVLNAALDAYREVNEPVRFGSEVFSSSSREELEENYRGLREYGHISSNEYSGILQAGLEAFERLENVDRASAWLGWSIFTDRPSESLYAFKDRDGRWGMEIFALDDDGKFRIDAEFAIALNLRRLLNIEFD